MKKTVSIIIAVIVILVLTLSFSSCSAEIFHQDQESLPVGTVFHAMNEDGVDITYKVMGDRQCQVGDGSYTAIDRETKGRIVIPRQVGDGYLVKRINDYAFSFCTNLTEIVIPEVREIGYSAFMDCKKLCGIEIPSTTELIDRDAFNGCSALCSINLPSKMETLDSFTFGLSGLTSISIPKGIKTIESSCFYCCPNLTSIELREGLKSIGKTAFYSCPIESITIPSSVIFINKYAFLYTNLKILRILSDKPFDIHEKAFTSEFYENVMLIVPKGSKMAYSYAKYWSDFKTIVEE